MIWASTTLAESHISALGGKVILSCSRWMPINMSLGAQDNSAFEIPLLTCQRETSGRERMAAPRRCQRSVRAVEDWSAWEYSALRNLRRLVKSHELQTFP